MLETLLNALDKLVFTALVLLGIQIPQFISLYQITLEEQYRELEVRINHIQKNSVDGIVNNANRFNKVQINPEKSGINDYPTLDKLIIKKRKYNNELQALRDKNTYFQMLSLLKDIDIEIAKKITQNYVFSPRLSLDQLGIGIVFAFVMSVVSYMGFSAVRLLFFPPHYKPIFASLARDIY